MATRSPRHPAPGPGRRYEDGWAPLTFDIPAEWWSGTDTMQTERTRARRRSIVRDNAKAVYRRAIRAGEAWRVRRFVALVGVAYPTMAGVFPSRAAETVKPIIDAGSDLRLWEDDDATHRCATIYFQMPTPAPAGHYLLTLFVLPVPATPPVYQVAGGLGSQVAGAWSPIPRRDRPDGWQGRTVKLAVPHRLWLSSNLTDSDLVARQHGAHKASRWGDGTAFGIRERVSDGLGALVRRQCGGSVPTLGRCMVIAGIGYPGGVGRDQADPDNCAESVNVALRSMIDPAACRAVAYYRVPVDAAPGTHGMWLTVLPLPPGGQVASLVGGSVADAWSAHGRMWP